MRLCQPHWDSLREALDVRGLTGLVAENGEEAAVKTRRQLEGEDTIDSYEPLIEATMAIGSNVMDIISSAGGDSLYLLGRGPEDPIKGHKGQSWPRCPICYINKAHEISCDGKCKLPLNAGYDYMIERAAEDALEHWQELRL